MRSFVDITYAVGHRMRAFLTSWNALIFCFFCLLSASIWYIHAFSKMQDAEQYQQHKMTGSILTEKQISVPVNVRNAPQGRTVVLFPSSITITASVSDEDYNALTEKDFRVSCKYPSETTDHLKLSVECLSDKVVSFHYSPEKVEYMIQ